MVDLTDKKQLISYLQSQGLYTKHSLGQNFLVDREVLDKIVRAADLTSPQPSPCKGEGDLVVEVGPGLGVLTSELVKRAKKVIAVEKDEKLADLLAQQFLISNSKFLINDQISKYQTVETTTPTPLLHKEGKDGINDTIMKQCSNLVVILADILDINIGELVKEKQYKVVANIPYYITSKIIKLFLTAEKKPKVIVMLVQKEVAERICSSPRLEKSEDGQGKPGDMSVLSLSVQAYGDPTIVDIVKASSFFPSPEVDSAILRIDNIGYKYKNTTPTPLLEKEGKGKVDEKELFRVIKIGFSSKRKTLLNNFSAGFRLNKDKVGDIIRAAGVDPGTRAQDLSLDDWVRLAREFDTRNG